MEIRPLADNPEEIATVAKWIYDEWGHLVPGRTMTTAHQKVRQCLDSEELPLTLVGVKDGVMVGTASIDPVDMATHPELSPWLASVVVDRKYRCQGIGSELCRRIADELRVRGIKTAYLFTPDQEALYARLGWKPYLREEYRGENVVIMRLDLA